MEDKRKECDISSATRKQNTTTKKNTSLLASEVIIIYKKTSAINCIPQGVFQECLRTLKCLEFKFNLH